MPALRASGARIYVTGAADGSWTVGVERISEDPVRYRVTTTIGADAAGALSAGARSPNLPTVDRAAARLEASVDTLASTAEPAGNRSLGKLVADGRPSATGRIRAPAIRRGRTSPG